MSPNASHRGRPALSSAASLITTLLISFDQEVLNQHLNLVTPEYPFFESPCDSAAVLLTCVKCVMPRWSAVGSKAGAPPENRGRHSELMQCLLLLATALAPKIVNLGKA